MVVWGKFWKYVDFLNCIFKGKMRLKPHNFGTKRVKVHIFYAVFISNFQQHDGKIKQKKFGLKINGLVNFAIDDLT